MEAMDFMDPRRRMQHNVMLAVGYVLVGIALLLITVILLFVAYGFGLKNGQVIQSGLLFLSSTPNPAHIYIDGEKYRSDTNAKLVLPEAVYHFTLKRDGYRDWQHDIPVAGGQVETYGYPFLFPANLTTNTIHSYAAHPVVASQSLDQRWLLVLQPGQLTTFDLYDLNNPKQAPVAVALPSDLLTAATGDQQVQVVAWADDDTRVLLKHSYSAGTEYLLFNRAAPDQSVNLTRTLTLPLTNIDLRLLNDHADRYIAYNPVTHELTRASLGTPGLQPYLTNILSFATTGDNFILYATPDPTDATKVAINLYDGGTTYTVRRDKAGSSYILALATYNGDMYIATATTADDIAFVYKNPIRALTNQLVGVAVPTQVFRIKGITSASFSPNGQRVVFEGGANFAVYDTETDHGERYQVPGGPDVPQTAAAWMDSARLTYVSHGQLNVVDFDGENRQVLVSADAHFAPIFDPSYKFLYTLVPAANDKSSELLTSTSLRTPADQ